MRTSARVTPMAHGKDLESAARRRSATKRPEAEGSRAPIIEHGLASVLLDNSPNPILLVNEDTAIAYVNAAMERATGFNARELIGARVPYPWWTENMLERFEAGLRKLKETGVGADKSERLFMRKDGETFWVQISTVAVRLGDGRRAYLTTWLDVTERKRIEDRLREGRATARTLLNTFADLAILIDVTGRILAINKAGALQFAKPVEELVGTDLFTLISPDVVEARKSRIARVIQTGRAAHFEDQVARRTFENDVYPVFDAEKKVTRLAVFARDITERRVMRDQVRATLKELTAAIPALVPASQPYPSIRLTPREKMVTRLLAKGSSTRETAEALGLSVKTIETHRAHIFQKLGVRNVVELAKLAIRERTSLPPVPR